MEHIKTIYTDLPEHWHKETLYDWGRRGLRTYHGRMFNGTRGRRRCFFDPDWRKQFEVIYARSGQTQLLRAIGRMTTEWVAVARRRGAFWPICYYLVPRKVAAAAREQIALEQAHSDCPF